MNTTIETNSPAASIVNALTAEGVVADTATAIVKGLVAAGAVSGLAPVRIGNTKELTGITTVINGEAVAI